MSEHHDSRDYGEVLCGCGCGKPTKISKRTRPEQGHVEGQPLPFLQGHRPKESFKRRSAAELLWRQVERGDEGECWEWQGSTNEHGYGRVKVGGRPGPVQLAHRVAWELINGAIPDGLCILHACDNPPCCNPSHLFLGTKADNTADMIAKGRARNQFGSWTVNG